MKHEEDGSRRELFVQALEGKRIPVLTLDNKWYQLLDEEARKDVAQLEGELNGLLKQQGKLNNEVKEIKRLKKRLMEEIVSLMGEEGQGEDSENAQKSEQNRRLVEECNEKLEACQDQLLDLPREIERANFQLMLATMDCCYDSMAENSTVQYTVRTPKLLSRATKPRIRKAMLMTEAKVDALTAGTTALRITASPVTPPVLKELGNLKK